MIDKAKTLEAFLETLESFKSGEKEKAFNVTLKDGKKVMFLVKVPDPVTEIALHIIRGGRDDEED